MCYLGLNVDGDVLACLRMQTTVLRASARYGNAFTWEAV